MRGWGPEPACSSKDRGGFTPSPEWARRHVYPNGSVGEHSFWLVFACFCFLWGGGLFGWFEG